MLTPKAAPVPSPHRPQFDPKRPLIVAIGSANTELIIDVDSLEIGTKGECRGVHPSFGGSALNWAVRLNSLKPHRIAGITILSPIGQDKGGREVRDFLLQQEIDVFPRSVFDIQPTEDNPASKTAHSVILIASAERTVRTLSGTTAENWALGLGDSVKRMLTEFKNKMIVMLGNIPKRDEERGNAAQITEDVVNTFGDRASFIYLNPGRAQYSLCYHHWEGVFPKLGCIQMNIDEARDFVERTTACSECRTLIPGFSKGSRKHVSLRSIMEFFILTKMTAVVTLAGSGSIAVVRDHPEKVIVTWPEEPSEVIDPTGSGDAFGAGVVWAYVNQQGLNSFEQYLRAFTMGCMWGAAACEERGGCAGRPEEVKSSSCLATSTHDLPGMHLEFSKASRLLYMLDNKKY